VATINQTVSTLRFFFRVTLKRHEIIEHMHVIHEPRKLPVVPRPPALVMWRSASPVALPPPIISLSEGETSLRRLRAWQKWPSQNAEDQSRGPRPSFVANPK
jgi:hypothetical protein